MQFNLAFQVKKNVVSLMTLYAPGRPSIIESLLHILNKT